MMKQRKMSNVIGELRRMEMKKNLFCCLLFIVIITMVLDCRAQEISYKVSWSNEVIMPVENVDAPNISGDAGKIVFIRYKDVSMPPNFGEIWVANLNGSNTTLLFSEENINITSPVWTPIGDKIIFLMMSDFELHEIKADKTGKRLISDKTTEKFNPHFTIDGTRIMLGLLGVASPGIYSMDLATYKRTLIFSTVGLKTLNVPFTLSPDNKMLLLLNGQELIFVNLDGSIKEKKVLNSPFTHDEEPIWTPDGKYIILGNLLYVLATGEEIPFLPDDVVRYKEAGKPDLIGPKSITLSKDGKKIAFVMEEPNAKPYRARIKIMDLVWQ